MEQSVIFRLSFLGGETERHEIDLYDVAHALVGFQRSLALTTHLVVNDEIITQAPALQNASIRAFPPSAGSWEIMAGVTFAAAAIYKLGTLPKDTPLGHLVYSAYDYLVKLALGAHVDYDKSLGKTYEELKIQRTEAPVLTQNRLESLVEKCEPALRELHRPIVGKRTAKSARITARIDGFTREVGVSLTRETYDYLDETIRDDFPTEFVGRVTSYNSNTFKGRVFIVTEGRPIAFDLTESARESASLSAITRSLTANTLHPKDRAVGYLRFSAFRKVSRTDLLKGLAIVAITAPSLL